MDVISYANSNVVDPIWRINSESGSESDYDTHGDVFDIRGHYFGPYSQKWTNFCPGLNFD